MKLCIGSAWVVLQEYVGVHAVCGLASGLVSAT